MSLLEFMELYGSEEQCIQALFKQRWPEGFRCPRCSGDQAYRVSTAGRPLFQCHACRFQASLTTGTLMQDTKLALRKWFLAIYLISQAKTGISSLALKRQLGVDYRTAWLLHHKLLLAMAEQDSLTPLRGDVQMDDAYLGGELPGVPGRGSPNKVPIVAAVSLDGQQRPLRVKLAPLAGFTRDAVADWAKLNLAPGCDVRSDGLACFAGVIDAQCAHSFIVVGARKPRDLPQFTCVNTVLGNLKTMINGAHKAFDFAKYAARYLGAFAYRFNRRLDLHSLVSRLLAHAVTAAPRTEKIVRGAELGH
jgi:transposase-like protein